MKEFSIQELEWYSGIRAHTLRAWESRYGIFNPQRKNYNQRSYSIADFEKLLYLAQLSDNGHRISTLSGNTIDELKAKVEVLNQIEDQQRIIVSYLILAMFTRQTAKFENLLSDAYTRWGSFDFLVNILLPFLQKTKLLFEGRQLMEEHLVVSIIRKKLILADTYVDNDGAKTVLLFLGDTDQLDLGLLVMNNLCKMEGLRVLYLGNDVSAENIADACMFRQPDYVYTYTPKKIPATIVAINTRVRNILPHLRFYFTIHPCQGKEQLHDQHFEQLPFLTALARMRDLES